MSKREQNYKSDAIPYRFPITYSEFEPWDYLLEALKPYQFNPDNARKNKPYSIKTEYPHYLLLLSPKLFLSSQIS